MLSSTRIIWNLIRSFFYTDFTPTVRNGVPKRRSKAGAIAGITIGALVLGVVSLFGIFLLVKKRRTIAEQQEGINYFYSNSV